MSKKNLGIKLTLEENGKKTVLEFYSEDNQLGMIINDYPNLTLKELLSNNEDNSNYGEIRKSVISGLAENCDIDYDF